ncbi:MAG TPA: PAS domain S-box protein [Thermoanaerobaculia bacterium]
MRNWLRFAAIASWIAVTIIDFSGSAGWLADILLGAAAVFAVCADGWIGGVIALIIAPFLLVRDGDPTRQRAFAEWIESLVIVVAMVIARRRIRRFQESESKLRALLASMDDVILILDRVGTYLEIVPTNPSLLYRPADEMVGRRIGDFFPADQTEFFLSRIATVLAERATLDVDYSLEIDGRTIWFGAAVSPLDDKRVIWVARDISERKITESQLETRVQERTRELSDTERALRTSEERYRSVFDQANDLIFTLSPEGLMTSLNPAFERILGWSRSEWTGKPFMALVPADGHSQVELLVEVLKRERSIPPSRTHVISKEGKRIVLELALVEQILQGKSVGFLGVARDITRRESAEERLRRSERQLADAERLAKVGSFEQDLITKTLWWSDELYRMFGLEPSAVPMDFHRFLSLLPAGERPKIDEAMAVLAIRGEHEWELRARSIDGAEKALTCKARLVHDARGGIRLVGSVQDVTEKKRAEQMLRESEERFRLLARATSEAVYDLDIPSGRVWRGEGYERLFGYAYGDLSPTVSSWIDLVHPDDRDRIHRSYDEAIGAGELSWTDEYRFQRADGSYANILDRAYIVRDAQKLPTRLLGAMMDISERKQLEQELEQAKRVTSLGRVAASIAHEVNNVLMGIQPNAEVIQRKGPAQLRHVSENIMQAVQRGKRVTDEILRYTRPTEPALQCVSVRKVLDRWSEEVLPLLGPSIDLTIEVPDDDIYVHADPLQIGQVFTNLALNARDAMQERGGGKLTVTAELARSFGSFRFGVVKTADRFIHFTVRDEGCGISDERLAHMFEPLFTTKNGGIGLGLAISYQVVTCHNGHIFVESEVGKGSSFHVFLPATLPLVHQDEPAQPPALSIRRLLLVEDEPAVASGICMLLQMEGVEVETVSTGLEAVGAIERFSPEAVVLDIGLPDVDGVTVYLEIHQRWPELPVLFSTGHGDSANLETYLARPNVGFILKPYDFEAIRGALATITTRRAEVIC